MAKPPQDPLNQVVRDATRRLMDEYDVTQAELARASGASENDVSRFLRGDTKYPPLEFLDALARVFKRRIWDLFAPVPRDLELRQDEVTVLAAWNAAAHDPEGRAGILALIRGRRSGSQETSEERDVRGATRPRSKTRAGRRSRKRDGRGDDETS